jgi:hypothetical protein
MAILEPVFNYRMDEEYDAFRALPQCYCDMLRECIAMCMSSNSKKRPTVNDLYQFAKISLSDRHLDNTMDTLILKDLKENFKNELDQALLKACFFGNERVAQRLLEKGAIVNARSRSTLLTALAREDLFLDLFSITENDSGMVRAHPFRYFERIIYNQHGKIVEILQEFGEGRSLQFYIVSCELYQLCLFIG